MLIGRFAVHELVRHVRCADPHRRAAIEESAHFPRRDAAAADDERDHRAAVQYEGKAERGAHRNFPTAGPATRIATYSTSTATKVMLE